MSIVTKIKEIFHHHHSVELADGTSVVVKRGDPLPEVGAEFTPPPVTPIVGTPVQHGHVQAGKSITLKNA